MRERTCATAATRACERQSERESERKHFGCTKTPTCTMTRALQLNFTNDVCPRIFAALLMGVVLVSSSFTARHTHENDPHSHMQTPYSSWQLGPLPQIATSSPRTPFLIPHQSRTSPGRGRVSPLYRPLLNINIFYNYIIPPSTSMLSRSHLLAVCIE